MLLVCCLLFMVCFLSLLFVLFVLQFYADKFLWCCLVVIYV